MIDNHTVSKQFSHLFAVLAPLFERPDWFLTGQPFGSLVVCVLGEGALASLCPSPKFRKAKKKRRRKKTPPPPYI